MARGGGACQPDRRPLITLVRHPAAAVPPGVCYGRLDVPVLNPEEAAGLAATLHGRGIVWTSPARRCRVVAEAIGPHHVDHRLQELDFGAWEGLPWDDVPRAGLDAWATDPWGFAPPGGESGRALVARVRDFAAALPPGDHVVITHGGPLKVLCPILREAAVDLLVAAPALGSVTTVHTHGIIATS